MSYYYALLAGLTPAIDPDAVAYLNAAGMSAGATYYPGTAREITAAQLVAAVSAYYIGLKDFALWDKFAALYLFLLGSDTSHKVNGKTPGLYDLTFAGPVAHSSNGILGNDFSAYADTGLRLPVAVGSAAGGYGLHLFTNSNAIGGQADSVDMGAYGSTAINLAANNANTSSRPFGRAAGVQAISPVNGYGDGYYATVQTSAGEAKLYYQGGEIATATGTEAPAPDLSIYLLAMNLNNSPYGFTSRPLQFAGIGRELTPADMANHQRLLLQLQTDLHRATI